MIQPGEFYAVSLGPGDPGLVTLRAQRTLEEADTIWYPATVQPDGSVQSVALDILLECRLDETRFRRMELPMSRQRQKASKVYDHTWSLMLEELLEGKRIAAVTVGDAGMYSTLTPLLGHASEAGISCSMIAGVPAFIAAGAAAGIPLVCHSDRLTVLAMVDSTDEVDRALEEGGTVVVMKLSTLRHDLVPWLEASSTSFLYAEKVGMKGEFMTSDIEDIRNRSIPYFSLLVCSRNGRQQ
ncbi:MAG: precorrin-2 C(20)-methyltransferase [Prosthecochloris sp.]|nr:precorrin-2 C(20)-methyltransferase [Prosthecochloris sp.]